MATPLKTVSLRPFIDVDRDTISCNHSYLLRRPLRSRHCYFCGPIPIIWGTWPYSLWAVILAVVLTILGIVMFIIGRKRTP
ncbi:MAG: DUF131 domain-containing protein [Candidatus Bathyarchaeia archaeon]